MTTLIPTHGEKNGEAIPLSIPRTVMIIDVLLIKEDVKINHQNPEGIWHLPFMQKNKFRDPYE